MLPQLIRSLAASTAIVGMLAFAIRPISAQTVPVAQKQLQARQPAATVVTVEDPDAQRTREQFMELLRKYPPSLGRILKLDPSLLANTDYLAPYPALGAFVAQHPEVQRNPGYYLERVRGVDEYVETRSESYRIWNDILGWIGGLSAATLVALSLGWLIRMVVDYRRWYRLSKVQAEAHTKLLDRLTSNNELIAYVQSPAGSRFLESAPITLEPGPTRIGAPFGRILWSLQAGVVLTAAGLGLRYVSGRFSTTDAAQPLFALGVLGVAIGLGFILSAAVSYVLSQRLGLIETPDRTKTTNEP